MDYKIIEIAEHLFTKYIDCEKLIECDGHIVDKQPAISQNNFKNLLKHLYSVCESKEVEQSESNFAIPVVSQQSEPFINFAREVVQLYKEYDIGDYDIYKKALKLINGC
jgi:hypothetical protein